MISEWIKKGVALLPKHIIIVKHRYNENGYCEILGQTNFPASRHLPEKILPLLYLGEKQSGVSIGHETIRSVING